MPVNLSASCYPPAVPYSIFSFSSSYPPAVPYTIFSFFTLPPNLSCLTLLYATSPNPTLPCPNFTLFHPDYPFITLPYPILSYSTLFYPKASYSNPTLPYSIQTIPYPTLSYQTLHPLNPQLTRCYPMHSSTTHTPTYPTLAPATSPHPTLTSLTLYLAPFEAEPSSSRPIRWHVQNALTKLSSPHLA